MYDTTRRHLSPAVQVLTKPMRPNGITSYHDSADRGAHSVCIPPESQTHSSEPGRPTSPVHSTSLTIWISARLRFSPPTLPLSAAPFWLPACLHRHLMSLPRSLTPLPEPPNCTLAFCSAYAFWILLQLSTTALTILSACMM